jgi:hypothetical protein
VRPMTEDLDDVTRSFARAFARLASDVHLLSNDPDRRLQEAIEDHLGVTAAGLPVVEQVFDSAEHPNLQLALEVLAGRSDDSQLFGLSIEMTHWVGFGLTNLASPQPHAPAFAPIAPVYVNVPVGVDTTMPCVSLGLWLLYHDGEPVVVLQSMGDPHRGIPSGVKIEAMAADRAVAVSMLADLQTLALAHNVYRGQMLSFTFSQWGSFGLEFHQRPCVGRDDLILPAADLEAIERHTLGVTAEADRLRDAGRHLKRGLLLYGPPGTGKTYTVEYLCTQMPERTTVVLSGQAMGTLGQAAAIARALQPSMFVQEDVDLEAMERTMPGMDSNPLLFQLLNEMDGLEEDADIIFVLTTNRVELLEPALAARPGRIDQAIEIRLPDSDARRRLLERYLQGVTDGPIALADAVARTDGTSAAFLKELVRRAALVAAQDGEGPLRVEPAHLEAAREDMVEHGTPILRRILGAEG